MHGPIALVTLDVRRHETDCAQHSKLLKIVSHDHCCEVLQHLLLCSVTPPMFNLCPDNPTKAVQGETEVASLAADTFKGNYISEMSYALIVPGHHIQTVLTRKRCCRTRDSNP